MIPINLNSEFIEQFKYILTLVKTFHKIKKKRHYLDAKFEVNEFIFILFLLDKEILFQVDDIFYWMTHKEHRCQKKMNILVLSRYTERKEKASLLVLNVHKERINENILSWSSQSHINTSIFIRLLNFV